MKKVIGWIFLICIFVFFFMATCFISGIEEGLVIWGSSIIIVIVVMFAIFLIKNGD